MKYRGAPFAISEGRVDLVTVPLKRPFITALGRKDATTNAVVRLRLRGGAEGMGEASGSVVMADHRPPRLARVLRGLVRRFRGADVRRLGPLTAEAWRRARATPAAAAAFECALTEALLSALGVTMSAWFGGARDRVETDLTISAGHAKDTADAAGSAAKEGFRKLKVKVGSGGGTRDIERVRAADRHGRRGRARPEVVLDGNQGLTERSALRLVEGCLKRGIRVVLLE
ncbi:enolase C-terminal domain-like protein, partial [Elusimicrobiota bacterium]